MSERSVSVICPTFYPSFSCIGPLCTDNCCHSWRIDIDKAHYLLYKQEKDPSFAALCSRALHRNKKSTTDAGYAHIVLGADGRCGFQDTDGGCLIYRKLGPRALSQICTLYPRRKIVFADHWELSLSLSCEEAVRMAVLTQKPLRLTQINLTLSETDPLWRAQSEFSSGQPARLLPSGQVLRSAVLELIQDRDYTLSERIVSILLLLRRMDRLEATSGEIPEPYEIERFLKSVKESDLKGFFDSWDGVYSTHLKVIRLSLAHVLGRNKTVINQRLMEMFIPYLKLKSSGELCIGKRGVEFLLEELSRKSDPFILRHSEWVENYLANYIFTSLFPLSRAQEISMEQCALLLAQQYAMLRIVLTLPPMEGETDEQRMTTAAVHVARISQHSNLAKDLFDLAQELKIQGTAHMMYLLR